MKHFGTVGRERYIRVVDDSTGILKTFFPMCIRSSKFLFRYFQSSTFKNCKPFSSIYFRLNVISNQSEAFGNFLSVSVNEFERKNS